MTVFDSVLIDLKPGFRRVGKSPGFATTVLLTLAIGIGANSAVFSVVDSVLMKPLPYPDSDWSPYGSELLARRAWLRGPTSHQ